MDKGTDLHAPADIQKADSLGTVEFMSACAEHVNMQLIHVDGNLSECLHRIRMEQDAVFLRDLSDLPDRLDGADLIIRKHNGNQDRILPNGSPKLFQIHQSGFVHIQICHLIALLFQVFTGMQNGMMLNFAGNDMLSF